jgi:hypothetical protein
MPTHAGTPVNTQGAPAYIGPLNPHDWLNDHGDMFGGIRPTAIPRGHPRVFSWWQRKPAPAAVTFPQPTAAMLHSRGFSRGAGAYAPKFGVLNINPIGAGVYAPYRLPTIAGPGARYVQTVPTSMLMNPTVPIETVDALIASSYVAGMYPTTG